MAIYNYYNPKMNIDANGKQITRTSIYQPSAKLPMTETDLMLQDLDLSKLESIGFDPKTVVTGKTLDQRIGKDAVKQAKLDSKIKTPPPSPVDGKGLSTIGAANIATGISTAANVATSIYGAIQASKMQPALMKYQAPTEAVLVKDNSSAIETAGKENIDKSINTARSLNQRNGLVGMDGVYIAKENEALNQLGSQLAQYRTGIDSQNVQIQNSINAQNKQTAMQVDQFNTQTQNQFDQYKSSLISMGMKNATDAITGFGQGLVNNSYVGKQNQIAIITSELSQINNLMTNNPNWHATPGVVPADVIARKKQLEEQLNSIYKSIV